MYVYKIIRVFLIAFLITYFSGCIWFFVVTSFRENNAFYDKFLSNDNLTNWDKLIICCYFSLTTLSTVGYGDYYPISDTEIITAIFYMICGVAFFSYIMGSFIEILSNYQKKMGITSK